MIIQPKKIFRKRIHKRRIMPVPHKTPFLAFGTLGLLFLRPFQITTKQLGRFVLILKKTARKREITNRSFWMRVFPNFPLTKKVLNSRMGKGKGKYKGWSLRILGNATFVETERVKIGRFHYMTRQIRCRTMSNTSVMYSASSRLPLFCLKSASKIRI